MATFTLAQFYVTFFRVFRVLQSDRVVRTHDRNIWHSKELKHAVISEASVQSDVLLIAVYLCYIKGRAALGAMTKTFLWRGAMVHKSCHGLGFGLVVPFFFSFFFVDCILLCHVLLSTSCLCLCENIVAYWMMSSIKKVSLIELTLSFLLVSLSCFYFRPEKKMLSGHRNIRKWLKHIVGDALE